MSILAVSQLNPPTILAALISSGTSYDVQAMLTEIAATGWKGDIGDQVQPNTNTVVWSVQLSHSGYASLIGYDGDWLVYDGKNVSVLHDSDFKAAYGLRWAAMSEAPVAQAESGLEASITLPQPVTSLDGTGYVYTVTYVDSTANTTGACAIVNQALGGSNSITLTVNGFPSGDAISFIVTCGVLGVVAAALPTAPITVSN